MADDLTIARPLTELERQDIVEIGKENPLTVFLYKLANKQQEYQRTYKPFDSYGARMDFEEKIAKFSSDVATMVDKSKISSKLDIPNLDKYGEASRFELENVREVFEDKLLDGIRNTVKTGVEYHFRTKARGNRVAVFIPNLEFEKVKDWYNKNFK